jgi:UDP-glucuronate 4-epimerase
MPIVICTGFPRRACAFSLSMGHGVARIWRCISSPRASPKANPIRLFNYGSMRRDFTYVDDVIAAVERLISKPPIRTDAVPGTDLDPATSTAPWRIYNIGNSTAVDVSRVVELLERELGRKAITELAPMQPGDVPETCADVDDLMRDAGFRPSTSIEEGVRRLAAWYREYHKL